MKTIKFLFTGLLMILSLFTVTAADQFQVFDFDFSAATPANLYVNGAICEDNSCSKVDLTNTIELYNGDQFTACWNTFGANQDEAQFFSCVDSAKITGNVVDLSSMTSLVTKEVVNSYGSTKQFFASGDSYKPMNVELDNYFCEFDTCVDTNLKTIDFTKKDIAIAEVGQLNVLNIDDSEKPIQVEVPISIDETVCSAFRFTNPDAFRFSAPFGYSDYSANTLVTLDITRIDNNANLYSRAITIPIEADACAGLAAFSWTPNSGMVDTELKFAVTTDVTDNQVITSIQDYAEDIETVYPFDLNNTAWVRMQDFTLSNINSFDMTSSVAQISEGETLFALFKAAAFKNNDKTPIMFEASVYFNSTLVQTQAYTSGNDLNPFSVDLSSQISSLPAGTYDVKIVLRPIGNGFDLATPQEQTQKLEILAPPLSTATFIVSDMDGNSVNNANINLELLNADDYYQVEPIYTGNQATNTQGVSVFADIIDGNYKYTVSGSGFTSVTNYIHIASDTDVYVTLPTTNVAPIINLPDYVRGFYLDTIEIDLRDYVNDYNDDFDSLTFVSNLVSGNVVVDENNGILTLSTNTPNIGQIEVFVQDAGGLSASDIIEVQFINSQSPEVFEFRADPDNGDAPFNTRFILDVQDADNDTLTCNVDFGDGTVVNGVACDTVDGMMHEFMIEGTYNVMLEVMDGNNEPVEAKEQVFVFERTTPSPHINYFTLDTSTGNYMIPTDVTLAWDVEHEANWSMTCNLRINGVSTPVNCNLGTYTISGYNQSGLGKFHLIVIDNASTQVLRTIERVFVTDEDRLRDVTLNVASTIVPGAFDFTIESNDEVLNSRDIKVRPIITCQGVDNVLKETSGLLSTYVTTKASSSAPKVFELNTNTNDFKLNVPTDETCIFTVLLEDEFGFKLELSQNVVFAYPESPVLMQSIRGKSTDVSNFMESALSQELMTGYNSIEFSVVNNEAEDKDLVIIMTAQDLDLNYRIDENLGSTQEKDIQIPIFIGENIESGMYPLRFSVYDGTDKQVRYTYLRVE